MKKLLLILYIFLYSLGISNLYSQDKKETQYLEVLEFILSKKLFDINKMQVIYKNDTSFFYSRSENYVENTEKLFEFVFDNHIIKVWPSDHVFFYDIGTYVEINDCQILNDIGMLNLELFIDRKLIKKLEINLIKKNNSWKIRKLKKSY